MKYSTNFISATENYSTYTDFVPVPYLRKSFELDFAAEKAEMLVCGLGFYEFWLNGEHLTRGCLAPYISNPNDLLYYDRYDLTDKLKKGKNVIAFALGNGMQNNLGGAVWDFQLARFRSAPKLALCFECSGDGKKLCFEADESFKVHASPTYFDDHRCGERYDARNELEGWNLPEFDDSEWNNAISVEAPSGECREGNHTLIKKIRELKPVSISKGHISHYPNPRENLPKVKLPEEEYSNDGYIYDFGENISGIVRLKIKGRRGQKIVMTCGESLFDGGLDMLNIGEFQPVGMTQCQVYICKGEGEEIWEPMFCYHGFRYCFVTGIDEDQATEDLLTYVVMHAELHPVGGFTCSNELVNKLQDATVRSDLANIFYFPTDCPHREKNGWTGDAHLSAEQFMINLDCEKTLREWLFSVRKAQDDKGALPGIVPTSGWGFEWGNGPAWDAVLTELPYRLWQYRGDKEVLFENATAIFRYVSYLSTQLDEKGLIHIGLGDWLPVDNVKPCPLEVTDTLVSMGICQKAADIFKACDMPLRAEFAQKLHDNLRESFRRHLVNEDLVVYGDHQTTQAAAIYYGVFNEDEKEKAFSHLLDLIRKADGNMTVGIIGARTMFHVLSEFGYEELALNMIAKPDYPSFASWITEYDANSLFEIITHNPPNGFSHNHHFFGDISAWFIKNLAGIVPNPDVTDANNILISPAFVGSLSYAEGWYTAPAGRIDVKWERKGGKIELDVNVPDGVNGKIRLRHGAKFSNGNSEIEIQSGKFTISE